MREFGVLEYEAMWFADHWRHLDGRKASPTEWLSDAK